MDIQLTPLHYVYLSFIVFIMALLIKRRDTTLICVLGIFVLGLIATESLSSSVSGIFNSFIFAIKELIGTIIIISIIVAMSRILIKTGVNEMMVAPLTRFLRTPAIAFWGIGIIMMVTSLFFWPSPACCAYRSCPAPRCCTGWSAGTWCRNGDELIRSRYCIIWGLYNPRSTEING